MCDEKRWNDGTMNVGAQDFAPRARTINRWTFNRQSFHRLPRYTFAKTIHFIIRHA